METDKEPIDYIICLPEELGRRLERVAGLESFAGRLTVTKRESPGEQFTPALLSRMGSLFLVERTRTVLASQQVYELKYEDQAAWDDVHEYLQDQAKASVEQPSLAEVRPHSF